MNQEKQVALPPLTTFGEYRRRLAAAIWPDLYISDTLYPVGAINVLLLIAGTALTSATLWLYLTTKCHRSTPKCRDDSDGRQDQIRSPFRQSNRPRIRITTITLLWAAYLFLAYRLLTLETWNPYAVLGLDSQVSPLHPRMQDLRLIKQAYRRLVIVMAPDKIPHHERPEAKALFAKTARAYHFLRESIVSKGNSKVPGLWVHRGVKVAIWASEHVQATLVGGIGRPAAVAAASVVLACGVALRARYRCGRQAEAPSRANKTE